jgi:hypothetical protein
MLWSLSSYPQDVDSAKNHLCNLMKTYSFKLNWEAIRRTVSVRNAAQEKTGASV